MSPASELRGGIDLGGTKIQTAIVDAEGKVIGEARHETPHKGGPEAVAEEMAAALPEAAEAAGVKPADLQGVGVGSPGDANERTGTVSAARNIPGWEGSFELGPALAEALGTEVRVGNDVQVATDAEFQLGAGKPYDTILGVFWGTGVGGGLILDGKSWLGRGAAAEIGHMVVKMRRRPVPLRAQGLHGGVRRARRDGGKGARGDGGRPQDEAVRACREARQGPAHERDLGAGPAITSDELAEKLIERALEALGAAIGSAVNLIDPEAIVFGGGMGLRLGPRYGTELGKEIGKHLFVDDNPPDFVIASLGDLGGAIGASLLVAKPAAAPA